MVKITKKPKKDTPNFYLDENSQKSSEEDEEKYSSKINEEDDYEENSEEDEDDENKEKESNNEELDLKRYNDPDGFSLPKMKLSLWIVRNRKHFYFLLIFTLLIISVLTWGRFLYVYGSYVLFGIKQDKILIQGISQRIIPPNDFFKQRAPKDILFGDLKIIKNNNDKYDFLIIAKNPNEDYWAKINYHLKAGEEEIAHRSNFILPGEEKPFLITALEAEMNTLNIKFEAEEINWRRVSRHKYPDWEQFVKEHLNFSIEEIEFTPADKTIITEKISLNTLAFKISNNSAYNYRNVNLDIVLYNQSNNIVIIETYTVNNFMSGESRNINITIPGNYSKIKDISILPNVDITKDDIYIEFKGGEN